MANNDVSRAFNTLEHNLRVIDTLIEEGDKTLREAPQEGEIRDLLTHYYYDSALTMVAGNCEFFFRQLILTDSMVSPARRVTYFNESHKRFTKKGNLQDSINIMGFLRDEFDIRLEEELQPLEHDWFQYLLAKHRIISETDGVVDWDFVETMESLQKLKPGREHVGHWISSDSKDLEMYKTLVRKIASLIKKKVK